MQGKFKGKQFISFAVVEKTCRSGIGREYTVSCPDDKNGFGTFGNEIAGNAYSHLVEGFGNVGNRAFSDNKFKKFCIAFGINEFILEDIIHFVENIHSDIPYTDFCFLRFDIALFMKPFYHVIEFFFCMDGLEKLIDSRGNITAVFGIFEVGGKINKRSNGFLTEFFYIGKSL